MHRSLLPEKGLGVHRSLLQEALLFEGLFVFNLIGNGLSSLLADGSIDFMVGAVLAAALLLIGLLIGAWISRRSLSLAGAAKNDALEQLLSGLSRWTNGFASDMSHIKQVIDVASEEMQHLGDQPADKANQLLAQIAAANDLLQKRISDAEQTLVEQSQQLAAYMNEARTDSLTGLPNRRVFDDELSRRNAEWQRLETPFLLMVIDVDHFKKINDTFGHPAGDAILKQLAATLRATLRQTDLACRFGGEEFVVLLPGRGQKHASDAAERLRQLIHATDFYIGSAKHAITVSIGVAQPLRSEQGANLFKRADEALYAAKRGGRNSAYWHDGEQIVRLTALENDFPVVETPLLSISTEAAPVATTVTELTPPVSAPPATSAALSDEPVSTSDFATVCADLRRKLKEVASST